MPAPLYLAVVPLLASSAAGSLLSGLSVSSLLSSLGPAPANDPRFTNFQAPGHGDVRSPCPGLNALANHGFIHHDGRNMTIPHLLKGLAEGLNMGADFTLAVGGAGLLSSPDPLAGAFDLNDLDMHNFPIEHDASLSRQDAYFGNDYSFNESKWKQVLNTYNGMTQTNIPTAAEARHVRFNDSQATNPDFVYGFREFVFSYGETAIYLQTMSDPISGVANIDYIRSLFEQEKLPYALGWRPSASPITLPSLGQMVLELFEANPQNVPEGETITADSYKNVFELVVGGSEILNNLTSGLSSAVGL